LKTTTTNEKGNEREENKKYTERIKVREREGSNLKEGVENGARERKIKMIIKNLAHLHLLAPFSLPPPLPGSCERGKTERTEFLSCSRENEGK
jgi:hypothetical protein